MFEGETWSDHLNYLASIEDNWYDGIDGKASNLGALHRTNVFMHHCKLMGYALPGLYLAIDEGFGITLEWSNFQAGQSLTLQITNDLTYDVYFIDTSLPITHKDSYDGLTSNFAVHIMKFINKYLQTENFKVKE